MKKKITGTITITSLGSGYVLSESIGEDIYIAPQLLNTALNGDLVEATIYPKVEMERPRGEITKVISRLKTKFVGTVERKSNHNFAFLLADDHKMYAPIFLSKLSPEVKNGFKALVEITKWLDPKKSPTGRVLKVIGQKGNNDVEMDSIVLERGLQIGFSKNVRKESETIKKGHQFTLKNEINKRRDFRKIFTFTIDPEDAKDFDDAISFQKISNDLLEIGVHIADVGQWVSVGSSIDQEARERGFSIYLIDRTVPMLPEVLSNNICSLNPNEDKLTFSAIFKITKNGELREVKFKKTIINSNKRFTYEEAQEIIEEKRRSPYVGELKTLMNLARKLRTKRMLAGAFDFDSDEVKVKLDNQGKPIKLYIKKGIESQRLIEEFMILTNREAASFIGNKGLGLFRIHERPEREKLEDLFLFLKKLGYNIGTNNNQISAKEINKLLEKVKGKDEEFMVKSVIICSLPKAVYSVANKGHFAMALTHYAHFTSPIRRYADLLVHRAIFKKLTGQPFSYQERMFYKKTAEELSQIEINVASAERASLALKQTEYMLERVGETRKGIISGLTEWGIYVQDIETRAEGLVRLKEMKDDFYIFNKKDFSVTGTRTKKRYLLGDKVRVKIKGGDIERKILNYSF